MTWDVLVAIRPQTDSSILAKAVRPSILRSHPRYSVEHVRDTFRFKGVVFSFRDALRFVHAIDRDRHLCPGGMSKKTVAKLDVAKLHDPKEWGWRFLAFDFVVRPMSLCCRDFVLVDMRLTIRSFLPDAQQTDRGSVHCVSVYNGFCGIAYVLWVIWCLVLFHSSLVLQIHGVGAREEA